MDKFQISRQRMVKEQLLDRGITDTLVVEAMRHVPRHIFVPEALQAQAYGPHPLPIGYGQTISQPYVVGVMSQLLQAQKGMRILEIGTGSGYQAAVLYAMGFEVHTVERVRELYTHVSDLFLRLRYRGIRLKLADGTYGWEEAGPFDRIIVTAGGPTIPQPLLDQLADPGILVIPVGEERRGQQLVCAYKENGTVRFEESGPVSFVDLVGAHGW